MNRAAHKNQNNIKIYEIKLFSLVFLYRGYKLYIFQFFFLDFKYFFFFFFLNINNKNN